MAYDNYNKELDEWFAGAVGFVEATDFEVHSLWLYNKELTEHPKTWVQNLSGRFAEIGMFGDKPVCLSMSSAVVDGQKVIFWDAVSLVVHHDIVKAWIVKHAPASSRVNGEVQKTNAQNFHCIFRDRHVQSAS